MAKEVQFGGSSKSNAMEKKDGSYNAHVYQCNRIHIHMHIYMGKVRVKNKLTKIDVTHTYARGDGKKPRKSHFNNLTVVN